MKGGHLGALRPHLLPLSILTAAAWPIIFLHLGRYGLVNGDEAFYHAVARNMLQSADWTRVEFIGEVRYYDTFTHMPLFVWLKTIPLATWGDDYFSMRIVSPRRGIWRAI